MAEHFPPITVLVVEDEPLILMAAVDAILDEGYIVETASNADEAIRILERNPSIRIVFTDVAMPGSMDGLKLAAYVRRRWPPIKLIVTSGKPDPSRMLPDIPFLSKPYRSATLTNLLGTVSADLRA